MKSPNFLNFLTAAFVAAVPLTAAATTINFDDLSTGSPVALSNQYASSGVIFDNIEAASSFMFNILPPSSPNYASPFWSNLDPGTIRFVDPNDSSISASTTSVTITEVGLTTSDAHPGNFSGAVIEFLDASGNVIPGVSVTLPATATATTDNDFTFATGIYGLKFSHIDGTTGAFPFDNLTFGPLTDVPEPSPMMLLSCAGAGAMLFQNRRVLRNHLRA